MDDFDDADIARAIALSLQDIPHKPTQKQVEVIEIDDDDDNDEPQVAPQPPQRQPRPSDSEAQFEADLQRVLELSKQETTAATAPSASQPAPSAAQPQPSAAAAGFLSERAKLERERLARLKRTRPDFEPFGKGGDSDDEERGAKRQHLSSSSQSGTRRANPSASSSSAPAPAPAPVAGASRTAGPVQETHFWDGELRQTANAHVDPRKDTRPIFRLSEILHPRTKIDFAIISAYCWNFPWVYGMMDPKTPVISVAQDPEGEATIKAILPNWVKTTPFLRNGMGCMHMKFMLLFYNDGRLRIVISTANLVEYDWRDIENTVWVQDVPKRATPSTKKEEDFASAMVRVLHGVNVAPALVNMRQTDHPNIPLEKLEDLRTHWDFSKVKARLVPSLAGKHEGWPKVILSGHPGLMKAIMDVGAALPRGKELVLECQGSSIGTYSTQWMNEFYTSCKGTSTQPLLEMTKARRAKMAYPPIKILFPTAGYVRDSALGEAGGGTMFCRRNQWQGAKFPRELFHQTRSKRGRVLMHSKMVLGTFRDARDVFGRSRNRHDEDSDNDSKDSEEEGGDDGAGAGAGAGARGGGLVGWAYVGSHNFTPSAWGTLSGSGFNPVLNITNYELGILLPLRSEEELEKVACWERPPQKYVLGKDEPWIQQESPHFVADTGR